MKASLRDVFSEAAEITDLAKRVAFLDSACGGDAAFRQRIERLLAADSHAGDFLKDRSDAAHADLFPEKIGERIGRYRLIERIGRGGCGVVYRAEQEEPVRREVALKVIKLGMDTQSVVARFEAERQALAMMDHPNIAKVLDAGATETGRPYFVMELVRGVPITNYCDQKNLPVDQRLKLFIEVCHAVQHAHQKGVIHRDLKPSNILVAEQDGEPLPKVIDFGVAKATDQRFGVRADFTRADQFIGTPAYMSPEQVTAGSRDIDTRSDVYSLGVILYELIAGQPPFKPDDLTDAGLDEMRRIIREVDPPRPSTAITRTCNRLPSATGQMHDRLVAARCDMDWIVMKCLEKDRARRYETANGLAMDVRRHLDNEPVVARPPTQIYRLQKVVRRHRFGFAAAGVIVFIMVAAVIVSSELALRANRAEAEQSRLRGVAENKATESRDRLIRRYVAEGNRLMEQNQPLAALPWMVQALELESGDARREGDERLRIAQAMIGAPELRLNFSQGQSVNCVALTEDGSLLATGSDDRVVRISHVTNKGARALDLTLPGDVGAVQFGSNGAYVAAMDMAGRARMWKTATGEPVTPILQARDSGAYASAKIAIEFKPSVHFSPDGSLLLVGWRSKAAQLYEAATGKLLREFTHRDLVYHALFSPDGKHVVTASKDRTARVWDVATGEQIGPPLHHDGLVAWTQFSSDGQKLLTVRDLHFVQLWNWREGRRLAPEIPRRSNLYHASLSPDGNRVFTAAWSGFGQVYDAATSQFMYQFQQHGGLVDASFSPDGRFVATACDDANAWIWDAYDATLPPMMLPQGRDIRQIAYSRDGRYLAVGSRGGQARVWELFPPPQGVRRLPGYDVEDVEFDASGRRALLLNTGESNSVSVYDLEGAKLVSSAPFKRNDVKDVKFSPDGQAILAFGKQLVSVLETESGREIFPPLHSAQKIEDALWSPDGKWIFILAGDIRAWEMATGKNAIQFSNSNAVIAMAVDPKGARVATAYEDNTVQFWEMATGKPVGAALRITGHIRKIRFSPSGDRLAITVERGLETVLELHDVATGKVHGLPLPHRDHIRNVEFSPDGRYVATACDDHSARIWNAETGEPISPWLPHDFEVRKVIFSPDSLKLATLTRRGATRIWSVPTGEPLTPPLQYDRNTGQGGVAFSPDSQRLLIARGGNEAWLRDFKPATATLEELKLLTQVISCTRFDPSAGMVPLDYFSVNAAWKKLRTAPSVD